MSKIILIPDTHIGLGFPNTEKKWFDVHVEYFDNFLIPLLKKEVKKGDIIVHLGDFFDNRNVIPINLLNYGMSIIEKISQIAPLHILIGNHDCYHKSTSDVNTLKPFNYIPNVTVYEKPTKIMFDNKSILMLPYIDKKDEQIEILKEYSGCDYLFGHSDLNGAKMHLTSAAHRNLHKIDIDEFKSYKYVFSGHIHLVQVNKNFTFIGNIFEMDRNDRDNQKGIFILNTENETERFIENNISPKFKLINVNKDSDIDLIDVNSKDWVDLVISNSLLTNNRKTRRKLEEILEKGNFATIEYVSDEVEEKKEEILETNEDVSLNLNYNEYISNYIKSLNYESDKIKNGVLEAYNNIIEINEKSNK
jgi:calcineurin-like phosphoesterase family protein